MTAMLRILPLLALSAVATVTAEEVSSETPNAVIETRATAMAEELEGRRDFYSENSAALYAAVSEILLPGFDVEYASKLVLGRTHWTAASEDQREQFMSAFHDFLVRTYSKGLLEFDQSNLSIEPDAKYSKDGTKALVKTAIKLQTGDAVQVIYALRSSADGWKIYDVRIDGVSYVQNYRSQFDAEISDRGLEAVIRRLENEAGGDENAADDQEEQADTA